jgi:exopolyphosphatase / guanosine-5'-triphosphate,3'-diphosphate pyrophosphatase
MNNLIAVIDLGTNSLITIIAEKSNLGIKVIEEDYQIIRLGEGLAGTGFISENAIQRCMIGFKKIKSKLNQYGVSYIKCVATSALRDAQNGTDIIDLIESKFNIPIHIISGIEEAKLVISATVNEFQLDFGTTIVFDIGGGSTEFIFIENQKVSEIKSLKIGAVRCTEAFFKSDPVRAIEIENYENYIQNMLNQLHTPKVENSIGIAGTVTTLATVNLGLEKYDTEIIHKSEINLKEISKIKEQFQTSNLNQRKNIKGLDPKRAEVILAGTIICEQIMLKYKLDKIKVSDKGLRWGVLYNEFNYSFKDS